MVSACSPWPPSPGGWRRALGGGAAASRTVFFVVLSGSRACDSARIQGAIVSAADGKVTDIVTAEVREAAAHPYQCFS